MFLQYLSLAGEMDSFCRLLFLLFDGEDCCCLSAMSQPQPIPVPDRDLERLWRSDVPVVPEPSQMDIVSTRTDTDEMQVTERKGVVSVRQGRIDWMGFLKTYCDLTESEARECSGRLRRLTEEELEGMNSNVVRRLGIEDTTLRAKVVSGIRFYVRNKSQT